jgi:rare lipoprotein A
MPSWRAGLTADRRISASITVATAVACVVALAAMGGTPDVTGAPEGPPEVKSPSREPQIGLASWYGSFHHGKLTASGERFDMHRMTAAHRTLPLGSVLLVENLQTGQAVWVRINDRGPYHHARELDLSYAAARAIGAVRDGVIVVRYHVVDTG